MNDVREVFEGAGYAKVQTYIQSGNIFFETGEEETIELEKDLEKILTKAFNYQARVIVRAHAQMQEVIKHIPKSWENDHERKHNVLFLRDAIDTKDVLEGLTPKEGIEEVTYHPGVLYWAANTGDITQTSMIKLSRKSIYQEMTVRNLNTTKKIGEIMEKISKEA
jgi:uncharacterized protein (DUF1697 family)